MSYRDMERWMGVLFGSQGVERRCAPPGRAAFENVVEHSFHLAMMGWYLNDALDLGLATGEILKFALTHDLAEVYAGDPLPTDVEANKVKAQKEADALARITNECGAGVRGIVSFADGTEPPVNPEARFVRALDKLMPRLLVRMGGKSQPISDGMPLEIMDRAVWADVQCHPVVLELYRAVSRDVYRQYGQTPPADLYGCPEDWES